MEKEDVPESVDSWQHGEVLSSIRQMPFRDLVAALEGEEAAAMLPTPKTSSTIVGASKRIGTRSERRTIVGSRRTKT